MPNVKKRMEQRETRGTPPPNFPLPRDSQALAASIYQEAHNIGLLFNKFLWIWDDNWTLEATVEEGKRKKSVKGWFLDQVKNIARGFPDDAYDACILRQLKLAESLRDYGYETSIFGKRAEARILSGLGGSHPMEVGFAFHPLYGFPYLCGSGLKGVARSWAEITGQNPARIKLIFGSESKDERQAKEHQQGDVIFFDAYAIRPPRLEVDILNPHFPDYYRDPKNYLPTEWQSPNPVNFLTIGVGHEDEEKPIFQFALAARSSEAVGIAQDWLERGLEQLGFGGKTASGYGYFAEGQFSTQQLAEIQRSVLEKLPLTKPPTTPIPAQPAKPGIRQESITPSRPVRQKAKGEPPKPIKPVIKPRIKQGDKIEAEVIANDGRRVTVQLLVGTKQEITFEHVYYPHEKGKKVKVKVITVTQDGKVTKISPG
jgi:CRISPR-associated protein Cmr6